MKCLVTREKLLDAVLQTEKVTVKNHTLPVLSCVILEVEKETLFVSATNLEVGIRFSIDVSNTKDGMVAVPGSVLSHVVSSISSGEEITLNSEKGHLVVTSKEGISKVTLQDENDFPVLPEVENGTQLKLPAREFKQAIQSVVYCASTSTIKPELSSVFVHLDGAVLITASTDSFRLAEKKIPLKKTIEAEPILVPGKSTGSLLRVLENVDEEITLKTNRHQLSIQLPNVYITLRLVSGSFPDYTQIIPKEFVTETTVLVSDFERVLKKSTVFSDQFNQTVLTVSKKNKNFTIHTKNENIGETKDIVSAVIKGDDLKISFNQKYLLESLHSISADSISIQFAGNNQPAVIRPISDDSFLYLVMPMNR